MAQNITLMGASYQAVPAVELPKTGGGTADFYDVSVATVTADNVIEGYTTFLADGTLATGTLTHLTDVEIDEITGGGGGGGVDTSQDTVDAAHLLNGYTAHDSTGSAIVGTYVPPTFATQSKTATPTTAQQTVTPDSGYDGLSAVTVNPIPSEYITVKTATGTFTGNGTRTIDISSVTFEPDIVYFTSDPGTTASSGTVAAIIVRGLMTATRYRNNSTTNSHYAIPDIANLNTSGSSYSWRATYDSTNSKLTLYCYSSNARGLLTSGRTYSYTLVKWT